MERQEGAFSVYRLVCQKPERHGVDWSGRVSISRVTEVTEDKMR